MLQFYGACWIRSEINNKVLGIKKSETLTHMQFDQWNDTSLSPVTREAFKVELEHLFFFNKKKQQFLYLCSVKLLNTFPFFKCAYRSSGKDCNRDDTSLSVTIVINAPFVNIWRVASSCEMRVNSF